jgi:hypothetical protein
VQKTGFKVLTYVRTDNENRNQNLKKEGKKKEFSHEIPNPVLQGLGGKMGKLELGLGFKVLR